MQCPYCRSEKIKVIDKRDSGENSVRRRRECLICKRRWTTYEKMESAPLVVIKKDGRREAFEKDKIRTGIMRATEKRPVSQEKIEKIVEDIENELRSKGETEIKSRMIGEMVMERLKQLDEVAYIRFASVYRRFKAVEDFEKELKGLKKK